MKASVIICVVLLEIELDAIYTAFNGHYYNSFADWIRVTAGDASCCCGCHCIARFEAHLNNTVAYCDLNEGLKPLPHI